MDQKCRILVVDDSPENREAVAELLSTNGYLVDQAQSGKEALIKCATQTPDLFLLDVVMPGMGGLELLREIHVYDSEYEAIMMTGYESIQTAKKAMELGAFSYVAKPLQWKELKAQVEQAMNIVRVKKERIRHLAVLEEEVKKRNDELRSTVQILENQGQRLDAVINAMEEGLLAIDDQEHIVMMNARAEKILGVRFGNCAGERLAVAITDPVIANRLSSLALHRAAGSPVECIVAFPVTGNGERFYHVNKQVITGKNGVFAGSVMTFLDRTDTIKADQLRTSFLSVVAHELRTPITVINNYLGIIAGEDNRDAVGDMKTACARLKQLVNSLISLASLSDASISPNWRMVSIPDLVEDLLKKHELTAADRNVTMAIQNNLRTPTAVSDPELLGIAFTALVDNAVKFSRAGGVVSIGLDEYSRKGEPRIAISISDNGCGIDDLDHNRLFEIFTQGENHMTRHYDGLGTGLFLAKRAVELLDGHIDVSSVAGKGTQFTLILPQHNKKLEAI